MISIVCAVRDLASEAAVLSHVSGRQGCEVIFVEGKNPSFQRNEGVKAANGEIIYFIDDDSIVPDGLIKKAAEVFASNEKIAVLGGPELAPRGDPLIQRAFGAVFASPWATGKSYARYSKAGVRRESGEKELILCNMFIKKTVFDDFGGFNERLYPNEENEFLNRLQDGGHSIIYDPELFIYRSKRKGYGGFIRQCFSYGRGRAEQATVNFRITDLINFVPAFFVVYLASAVFFWDLVPLIAYAAGTAVFSAAAAIKLGSARAFFLAGVDFFILHACYGAGSIWGLYTATKIKEKNVDRNIRVKKVMAA